jgi:hypothetical protein
MILIQCVSFFIEHLTTNGFHYAMLLELDQLVLPEQQEFRGLLDLLDRQDLLDLLVQRDQLVPEWGLLVLQEIMALLVQQDLPDLMDQLAQPDLQELTEVLVQQAPLGLQVLME